ncbi:tyrosine-sulfated glycopeptide receptor 1 [Rhodamnia argentea]|uniref:Tyrosine-sulfated glycopeptide receptor 1 n=1 Tax=Rhodamnia argentea TaxID=178133 RepID=A0A8B8NP45_9MYRT|nr:tyrosine-sulfated glycopeptide receptor 1 [Rhodamnia argentea]
MRPDSPGPTTPCSRRAMLCHLALLLLLLLLACHALSSSAACDPSDRDALRSFLSGVSPLPSADPLNWAADPDCCGWEGVLCDPTTGRVLSLLLPGRLLNGTVSPSLGNLTSLTHLNLSRNRLSGALPADFFAALGVLRVLDLSFNGLSGDIPYLPRDNAVQALDLSSNAFRGAIPPSIFQFGWNLISFNASDNRLAGTIPSPICDPAMANSSRLVRSLDFSGNNLSGEIPSGLGSCSDLAVFRAGFNSLTGEVPGDLYAATSLVELSLHLNRLNGPIGDGIGNLSNLRFLLLYSNNFSGSIPASIGKLAKLEYLLLYINNLTGSLPSSLNNCVSLKKLILRVNHLGGDISAFDFSRLQKLTTLDLGDNNFTGKLPSSLYSCKSLTAIRFATNRLEGQIPPEILSLQSLTFLSISNNSLSNITGAISILMNLKNLSAVILSMNFGGGGEAMPQDDNIIHSDGFPSLQILALGGCQLTGEVPIWLNRLKGLEVLDLSQNFIKGTIPGWFAGLPNLFYLDLSSNLLSGGFPVELTRSLALTSANPIALLNQTYLELPVFVMPNNATNQQYNQLSNLPPAIYLFNNSLTGPIPVEIGQLTSLHVLDLHHNHFSGSIPNEICLLTNLEKLDLSSNELTGAIPASLKGLHFLSSFSVADNDLQGPVPTGGQFDTFPNSSFMGNPGLCGEVVQNKTCNSQPKLPSMPRKHPNKKLIVGLIVGTCFIAGLMITFGLWVLSKRRISPRRDTDNTDLDNISINSTLGIARELDKDTSLVIVFQDNMNDFKDLTISEILAATDNFNQANIIGCGAFGLVYRAILPNGEKLAVKKLSGDMGLMEKEFKAEVEVLSNARHENLVALQGYCIHEGSRLLIYTYMENGSLDYWLHEKSDGPAQLDWPSRLKIAQGASCGLAYMHLICEPHIVHRDIKSSNILLDEKFEAHVADFGLSRLILPYHTHVTTELVGTLGYIPPEYAHSWIATLRGDVYSFGVVMLELLTGKRPVDVSKPKESRELVKWVHEMGKQGRQEQIFDSLLRGKGFEDQMLQVLDVAMLCVNDNPVKRPTIKEVVDWLKNVGINSLTPNGK